MFVVVFDLLWRESELRIDVIVMTIVIILILLSSPVSVRVCLYMTYIQSNSQLVSRCGGQAGSGMIGICGYIIGIVYDCFCTSARNVQGVTIITIIISSIVIQNVMYENQITLYELHAMYRCMRAIIQCQDIDGVDGRMCVGIDERANDS